MENGFDRFRTIFVQEIPICGGIVTKSRFIGQKRPNVKVQDAVSTSNFSHFCCCGNRFVLTVAHTLTKSRVIGISLDNT